MTAALPTFATSDALRRACATRSALTDGIFTDACWEIARAMPPCGECLRDIGVEPGDEYDLATKADNADG